MVNKMKKLYLILLIFFTLTPFLVIADGCVVKPIPNGDLVLVEEKSQQAYINYVGGREKLIIAADIEESSSDIFWIIPVPSKSEDVNVDITSQLPYFIGDDVKSKVNLKLSNALENSYFLGFATQIWPIPVGLLSINMSGSMSSGDVKSFSIGDSISVDSHIEKAGMVSETITAKNGEAIYDYLSQKGFNVQRGRVEEINSYIKENYSFVVSWIANNENVGQRGIYINFPTDKIYYPLILTSAYGDSKLPIIIRVLGYVKPEIFSSIKPYTKVDYFTERTGYSGGVASAKCRADMDQLRSVLEVYRYSSKENLYPQSIQETEDGAKILVDMSEVCGQAPFYFSEGDEYVATITLDTKTYKIDSTGYAGFTPEKILIPNELQDFYGANQPGKIDYTRITIDAPSKLLTNDLWMEQGTPLSISAAFLIINSSNLSLTIIIYLLLIGIVSYISGGLAGLMCFRKFKKYAFIGLCNVFTIIPVVEIFNRLKKKGQEDVKYSNAGFIFLFSIIFFSIIFILMLLPDFSEVYPLIGYYLIAAISLITIVSIFTERQIKKLFNIISIIIILIILYFIVAYFINSHIIH